MKIRKLKTLSEELEAVSKGTANSISENKSILDKYKDIKIPRMVAFLLESHPDDIMSILSGSRDNMDVRYTDVSDVFETYPEDVDNINESGVCLAFEDTNQLAKFEKDFYDGSEEYEYDTKFVAYFEDDKANKGTGEIKYIIYSNDEAVLDKVTKMMDTKGYPYSEKPLENYIN